MNHAKLNFFVNHRGAYCFFFLFSYYTGKYIHDIHTYALKYLLIKYIKVIVIPICYKWHNQCTFVYIYFHPLVWVIQKVRFVTDNKMLSTVNSLGLYIMSLFDRSIELFYIGLHCIWFTNKIDLLNFSIKLVQ